MSKCEVCGEYINRRNTSTYWYTKKDKKNTCGKCYLKKKAEMRKKKGEQ
tara:strand:- start:431 stop:577 length:147 start_codon:yes stop_codon:yes gene_type:complete